MRYSLHEWVIVPMGLKHILIIFLYTINNLFKDNIDSGIAVFLDNVLMYSHIATENSTLLEKILVHFFQYSFIVS